MIRRYEMALLLVCLVTLSMGVKAACSFNTDTVGNIAAKKSLTMPVNATISVTSDLSTGQKVFEQDIHLSGQGRLSLVCDSAGAFLRGYALSPALSTTVLDSITYPTGLPGIGIRFKSGNSAEGVFPGTLSGACGFSRYCIWEGGYGAGSQFHLVKTGTVSPGIIDMSTLPELVYTFGQSGSMIEVYRIKMSGTIKVTVPTCNIVTTSKTMTVNLGKHKLANFSGTGSVSGWVDASIHLEGCGQFYGTATSAWATFDGTNLNPGSALTPNQFSITLTPRDGVESVSGKGVMKIKQQQGGAVGFGIQLSRSQSDAGVMNLTGASYTYVDPLPNDGRTTVTVPLYARYIRTAATAYAGRADGTLEYTVSYK